MYTVTGQTFPGMAGALIPPGAPNVTIGLTTASCTVYGVGIIGEGCTEIDNVAIDITHTYTGDLGIFIISPAGDVLELSSGNGGTGNNFTSTVFTDTAALFITQGIAPYTGFWRPEGRQQSLTLPYPNVNPLGTYTFENVFDGVSADGEWTLYINDFLLVDVGVINSWSITFTGGQGPVPTVDLGTDLVVCEDQPATLIAEVNPGADTWEWSTGETTQSITVNPTSTTTYMVTVTNNGCMDTASVTVAVQPNNIMANAGEDEGICEGLSIDLTGTGGGSGAFYQWSNGQQGSSITVNPNATTLYTLTVTDGVCSGTDEVEVTVNPNPIADAGPPVMMCDGMTVELTASGGSQNNDYTWSTGQNAQSIVVSPFVTTTYTVTVTDGDCEDEDNVEVTVVPAPEVDAGDDEVICLGETIQLTATGTNGEYEWSTGQIGPDISVSPTNTTSYTVSLTQGGCTGSDDVEVDVINVVAGISPNTSICEGESTLLTATGGTNYLWSNGQTTGSISVSPIVSTLFSVTVSQGSCLDTATVQVDVFPALVADISAIGEICAGDTIMIVASGGTGYQWSNGASVSAISVSPSTTSLYVVTVSDAGCSVVDSVLITVHAPPVISLGPPVFLCAGDSVMLLISGLSGNESLIWNTGDTTAANTVSPLADALYAITATDSFGCTDESSVFVTVLPAPTPNAGPDIFIMSGDTVILTGTGTGDFLWSTGETSPVISVFPGMTTTYMLTVTLNGCTGVDEVIVFVNEVPPVDLGSDLTICPGETVTLNALVPGPFMLEYLWSNGDIDSSITVTPLGDTTFFITVTDIMSGFFSLDTISIILGSLPLGQPIITGPGEGCLQEINTYSVSGVSGATLYTWVVNGGNLLSGQGTQSVNIEWTSAGVQQVMLIAANDCGSLPGVAFNMNVLLPPELTGPVAGPTDPCVFALAGYSIPALAGVSNYNWSISGGGVITTGQGTTGILVDWNGALAATVCVEAINVCGVSSPLCLDVMPTQSPVISAGPDLESCSPSLTLQGMGAGTWEVVSGTGQLVIIDPSDPKTSVMSQTAGAYVLAYESGAVGCESSDTVLISFNTSPVVSQVLEVCSSDLMSYTVSFQISGGQSPYRVNGTIIPSNTFVSGQMAAGNTYMFQVEDSNGCLSAVITGIQSCNCTSLAGEMDTLRINRCIGDSLIASNPFGVLTGPDDTLAFVLHDGQLPDGIIAWSDHPVFPFIGLLQSGKTYYISAVVGPKGINGFPDTSDPCFSWSMGTPFLFFEPPVVDLPQRMIIPCDPKMIQLDIGGSASGNGYNYFWTAVGEGIILGAADTTYITAGSAGSYILTIEHALSGCKNSAEVIVEEDQVDIDSFSFEVEPPSCAGDCNGQILITQAGANWLFDFGDGVFTDLVMDTDGCPGIYVLNLKNEAGCIADTTFSIPDTAPLTVDLGPDLFINDGESIQLHATSQGSIIYYDWYTADTCTLCTSIVVQPDESALFEVEVTDQSGCTATDQVLITVRVSKDIYLPNVFSPNGDQINDELGIPAHPELSGIHLFEIYDRWGNIVFRALDQLPGSQTGKWDGNFQHKAMNPGVYICMAVLEFRDGTTTQVVWDATLIR